MLAAQYALITGITLQDSGTITLTEAQATTAHVADTADLVLTHIDALSFAVTGATVAQLIDLDGLHLHPASITIADQTANIRADLELATPTLIDHIGQVTAIVGDGGTLSLTVSQFTAADAVLAMVSNATLQATGASVSDIPDLFGLTRAPDTITLSDSAANIESDLLSVGGIMAHIGNIQAVAASGDGIITLATSDVLGGSLDLLFPKLQAQSLHVTGAALGDITNLQAIGASLGTIAIHDDFTTI